jgi:hypothetical protein
MRGGALTSQALMSLGSAHFSTQRASRKPQQSALVCTPSLPAADARRATSPLVMRLGLLAPRNMAHEVSRQSTECSACSSAGGSTLASCSKRRWSGGVSRSLPCTTGRP